MTISREMLAAYAQGQLNDEGRALVEAAIAADPALRDDVARHHALRERLQARFDPVLTMPVPDKLLGAVRPPAPKADIIDLNVGRAAQADKRRGPSVPRWITGGAIAAALAIGLVVGSQMQGGGSLGGVDGQFVAQGDLDKALTTQPASGDKQPVHILLSLRNAAGQYCRVFQTDAAAGLACRTNDAWRIERLQSGGSSEGGEFRQAGSALGEIMAVAQDMAPQGALDPEQEQAALEGGWK